MFKFDCQYVKCLVATSKLHLSSGLWRQDYENRGKIEIHEQISLFRLPEVDKVPQASLDPYLLLLPLAATLTGCFNYQNAHLRKQHYPFYNWNISPWKPLHGYSCETTSQYWVIDGSFVFTRKRIHSKKKSSWFVQCFDVETTVLWRFLMDSYFCCCFHRHMVTCVLGYWQDLFFSHNI